MYNEHVIKARELRDYRKYIPGNYMAQLRSGHLTATAVYDGDRERDELVGVYVNGVHEGWFEIVWVGMGESYKSEVVTADFIRYFVRQARRTGKYKGAFMEPHITPENEHLKDVLRFAGMDVSVGKDNIFEFRLSEVIREKSLGTAAKGISRVQLQDASPEMKAAMEEAILQDERAVPVAIPIPWEDYRQDLSLLYAPPSSKSRGVLLFSEVGDSIFFELAYSDSPRTLAALVGSAILLAEDLFPPEQKILVPVVRETSRQLVEHLVPTASRGEVLEAIQWF